MKLHAIIKSCITPFFVIAVASVLLASAAQAECNYFRGWVDNNDGTVRDPRNGLVWKRCSEGFEFSNGVCTGKGVKAKWDTAMSMAQQSRFLGQSDWRLPSKEELSAVMGSYEECKKNGFLNGEYAASKAIAHSEGMFWSSTPDNKAAWSVSFSDGGWGVGANEFRNYVRLVRASRVLGGEAAVEFMKDGAGKLAAVERQRAEQEVRQKDLEQKQALEMKRQRIAEEEEYRQNLLAQERERKKIIAFRKSLREGDDTNCGPVIEVKGKLVKVAFALANFGNEHWIKRDQILSPGYDCRFVNGQYQPEQ